MTHNMQAFLALIAHSEIGPALLAQPGSDRGYRVMVGSTPERPLLFYDYVRHPGDYAADGSQPKGPGLSRNKAMNSDAAGRYQFMGRYWPAYRMSLGLPDFGPASQDRWAIQLIRECRAVDDVDVGRIDMAVTKCRSRWASLPGAGYGQHENHIDDLLAAYEGAGGVLA